MKLALCMSCSDFVAPLPTGDWRWCHCGQMGVRWSTSPSGQLIGGHLLVTHQFTAASRVRVLGLNNNFIANGLGSRPTADVTWRHLHSDQGDLVPDRFLFSSAKRDCWAVLFAPGDTGDVAVVDFAEARRVSPPA